MPHMPFEIAHALLRFAWHESWSVSLATLPDGEEAEALAERRKSHESLAKEALETWNVMASLAKNIWPGPKSLKIDSCLLILKYEAMPWASGPRGAQRGRLDGKSTIELQKPARQPYKNFETAHSTLENLHGTLAHALFERIVDLLWAVAWHAANTVANQMDSNEEEEEEGNEDEDGEEGDEDDDEADEQEPFGPDYPGSSDDAVEDMRQILTAFHGIFHSGDPYRGVRCALVSATEGNPSVLESISRVPGAFGEVGLNAVRLLLPDWSGCSEAVDSTAADYLLKAEALNLQIILEVPALPGKPYEDWLRSLARSVSLMKCVTGVALPRIQDLSRAAGLVAALRQGGLTQDRCACFLQLPEGQVGESQEVLYQSDVSIDADALPLWLSDGHVLIEAPAHIQFPEKALESAQMLLDAASFLSEDNEHLDLVSSWSLALPCSLPKANSARDTEIMKELGQRMLSAMEVAERGWFFESWSPDAPEQGLQACLQRDWINLATTEQVMYPPDNHTRSLIYLHGFTCSGYDYLKEPHYEEELEPFPGLKVVFPTAPKRSITCYKGEMLHSWHDYITDHEGDQEDELSMEDLHETTARIHALLDAEAALVTWVVKMYFSAAPHKAGSNFPVANFRWMAGTMGHLLTCTPINAKWVAKKIPIFVYNGLDDSTMKWHEQRTLVYKMPKLTSASFWTRAWIMVRTKMLIYIGTEIVKVRNPQERLGVLQSLIDQEINRYLKDDTPVPAQMLAPHGSSRKRSDAVASILRVNRNEARVLSSKARAPYMVLMEVEDKPLAEETTARRGLLGRLCASRKSPVQATHHFAAVPPKFWPPEDSPPASARNVRDARPKGAFHDETWPEVVQRVRAQSDFGRRPNWSMIPMIVKSNADDVRQEELAFRLLKWFERVFKRHNPKLWLQPFLIVATTHDGGLLEVVTNAISISELKKTYGSSWVSLRRYFEESFTGDDQPHGFGREKSVSFRTAKLNFIYSMAAYSVVCYVLAIRDRHNGNIMLNDEGHVLHVDFGFMLCGAPGGKAMQHIGGFEHSAGFKLTNELVEVLGPTDGHEFQVFRSAILDGMRAVRTHAQELLGLVQLSMLGSENSQMNCFCHPRGYPEAVLEDICDRLGLPGGVRNGGDRKISDEEFRQAVNKMIDDSIDHWRSRLYDTYQYHFVGVH
eukprot:symbB.v1.2.005897.t1/scaffold329.1/size228424/7